VNYGAKVNASESQPKPSDCEGPIAHIAAIKATGG
jgi:hypothetical protein